MLVYGGCCLRPTIAINAAEIESVDAMLAEGARECSPAVYRFGRVISHRFILDLLAGKNLGQQLRDLGAVPLFWVCEPELNRSIADAAPMFFAKTVIASPQLPIE
jgi:hypothetical protein